MKTSEFNYILPEKLIAQQPLAKRHKSRLLLFNRQSKAISETVFEEISGFLREGDVLVLNNTRVLPVRLFAYRKTGAKIEILLIKEIEEGLWQGLLNPSRRLRLGEDLIFRNSDFSLKILERQVAGLWLMRFFPSDTRRLMNIQGVMPTPPYIKTELKDSEKYQTVFATEEGAIAAPTSGLHFTKKLIAQLVLKKVNVVYITLHIGLGTFKPVKTENIDDHIMESEYFVLSSESASIINTAKQARKRVFACGTSVVRTLESQAVIDKQGLVRVSFGEGHTCLFIRPGYNFKIVDCLLTNFHLPQSTNLALVSAFAGKDEVFKAYEYAKEKEFRFYSFGDAMLII